MYVYSLLVCKCSLVIGCGSEWHVPVDSASADSVQTSLSLSLSLFFCTHLLIIVKVIIVILMIYSNW